MKITEIVCRELAIPSSPFQRRAGLPDFPSEKNAFILQIKTDGPHEGFCIWDRNGAVMRPIVEQQLRPMLVGRDPTRITEIWHLLTSIARIRYFPKYVIGVVDIALWDLWAKSLGVPVARLAGGFRDSIQAYASTHSYQSIDEYEPVVRKAMADGYRALKLHGPGTAERDLELCRVVRQWVGPDFPLMFDATGDYSYEDAMRIGRELERLGYLWFEEPIRDSQAFQLQRLTEKLDIPVLVAESTDESFYDGANQLLLRTGVMLHGDPFIKAGMTGLLKTATVCEAFGVTLQVHHSETYGLHAACAIKNTMWYEQIVPESTLQFDVERDHVRVDAEGKMHIPNRSGFGVEIDWPKVVEYEI